MQMIISLVASGLAIVVAVFSYVLAIAKMRWELDLHKKANERQWEQLGHHEEAINAINQKVDRTPAQVEKRLDKLEGSIDDIKTTMAEISGEVKALTRIVQVFIDRSS